MLNLHGEKKSDGYFPQFHIVIEKLKIYFNAILCIRLKCVNASIIFMYLFSFITEYKTMTYEIFFKN